VAVLETDSTEEGRTEMDSHADTCVLGRHALITHDFERPVHVSGYDKAEGTKEYQTVSGALGYIVQGQIHILQIHQAIYIPSLDHNLLCPMQLRLNKIGVNEVPKFLSPNPTNKDHALVIPQVDGDSFTIPLMLEGVTSYFDSFKPTAAQYEAAVDGVDLHTLTYDSPEWDPSSTEFARQEDTMTDPQGDIYDRRPRPPLRLFEIHLEPTADTFLQQLCANRRLLHVRSEPQPAARGLNAFDMEMELAAMSTARAPRLTPEILAKRFGIGLEKAQKTIEQTTQRGFRTVLHPSLSRRYRTNDRQLRYRRLSTTMFTDTMLCKTLSRRGNRYAQVFYDPTGWKRAFPMKKKSEAHEALTMLFQRDGVPAVLMMDGSKEQTKGLFDKKAKEADVHTKQIEPHTPMSNKAETGIKELKLGTGRKMIKSRAPKLIKYDRSRSISSIHVSTCSSSFCSIL